MPLVITALRAINTGRAKGEVGKSDQGSSNGIRRVNLDIQLNLIKSSSLLSRPSSSS